ncbi:hypothetical protein VDS18_17610 [Xanthomonas campestris pv. campestris]|nr:hypothetical protein [Xanthomonas campestris pv. campestris]
MVSISIAGLDSGLNEKLPACLAPVFIPLFKDLLYLSVKWHEYRVLYGDERSVDLLNRTAGHLFKVVQDVLWDDILLHITRLVSPEKSMGKSNLTLLALPALIDDPELSCQILQAVEKCKSTCAFTVSHRNKRLAHHDLAMALSNSEKDLDGISRSQIDSVIDEMGRIANLIYGFYLNSYFDLPPASNGGAEVLLWTLEGRFDQSQAGSTSGIS